MLVAAVLTVILANVAPAASAGTPLPDMQRYVSSARSLLNQQITAISFVKRKTIARYLQDRSAEVIVEFFVDRSGTVTATKTYRSSGSTGFDQHVLWWAKAMKFPPFPADIKSPRLIFALPLIFTPNR